MAGEILEITHTPEERQLLGTQHFLEIGYKFPDILWLALEYKHPPLSRITDNLKQNYPDIFEPRIKLDFPKNAENAEKLKLVNLERRNHAYAGLALTGLREDGIKAAYILESAGFHEMLASDKRMKHILREERYAAKLDKLQGLRAQIDFRNLDPNCLETMIHSNEIIKFAMKSKGIEAYDPAEAPMNPMFDIRIPDHDVFLADFLSITSARYVTLPVLTRSSGVGVESAVSALLTGKITTIFVKEGVNASRMIRGIPRAIVLQYRDLEKQKNELADYFGFLQNIDEFGLGICQLHKHKATPVYHPDGDAIIKGRHVELSCLKCGVQSQFKDLFFDYTKVK